MKAVRDLLLLLAATLITACERGQRTSTDESGDDLGSVRACYERALEAFDGDSIRLGEQLLNQAIRLATASDDLHTLYLAQSRLAESLAWGNSEAALEMAKQALATYERRPDDERNHIILLDYIGTYASQLAFNTDGSFDEALDYTNRAYQLALASRDSLGTEQMCQTLTSLANIHWAMKEYTTALGFARQAVACADDGQLLGVQQVLARCLVSCDSLAEAEAVYRQMQPGADLQAAYIVQSNLAKLALHRSDIAAAEEAIDSAFSHAEDLYYKALQQKDEYYQTALQQELDNEQLRYRTALQRRTLWSGIIIILLLAGVTAYIVRHRLRDSRQKLASCNCTNRRQQRNANNCGSATALSTSFKISFSSAQRSSRNSEPAANDISPSPRVSGKRWSAPSTPLTATALSVCASVSPTCVKRICNSVSSPVCASPTAPSATSMESASPQYSTAS